MRITNDVNVQFTDGPGLDAFGRLRISNPLTLFESKQLGNTRPLIWDDQEVSGSGTSTTYNVNKSETVLGVGATTAGKRVRQSFQRQNYQPGKGQKIVMTGAFANQTSLSGITSQIGAFDDKNGLFFSYEDGVMKVVIRSYTTGAAVDNAVAQTSWNLDKLDGTGKSGIDADWTKAQIIFIDFEWLAIGRVRFGVFYEGQLYYCHEFTHANKVDTAYLTDPNLPLRYSIENDGTGAATTMKHICSEVTSEGGAQDIGLLHYLSNGTTEVTATTAGTYYALLGIRLNSSYLGSTLKPVSAQVLMTSAGSFEWQLLLNPTISGTPSWSQVTNAGFDSFVGSSSITVSDGTPVSGGYGGSTGSGGSASGSAGGSLETARTLGSAIDGTVDTLVLAATGFANGETFTGAFTIRELS